MKRVYLALAVCLLLLALFIAPQTVQRANADDTGEKNSSVLPEGPLDDGFYVVRGMIYAVRGGAQVRSAGSFTLNGVTAKCINDAGVCLAEGVFLTDVYGDRYCLEDGTIRMRSGPVERNGSLYYVQWDGRLLRNGSWKTLDFDESGRYTSGSPEIDAYIDQVLEQITEPSMTREEKLWACYCYVYDTMEYQGNNNHVPFGENCREWSQTYMLRLIERGKGNCYCFGSEMYYLSRRIGYPQARAISGQIGDGKRADHGWCEIVLDGVPYALDPELDKKRCETMGDIYLKPYTDTPWAYWRP